MMKKRRLNVFAIILLLMMGLCLTTLAFSEAKRLSAEALQHGKRQVQKMLEHRPVMKEYVTEEDTIWQWAVRKFAGEDLLTTIDWNPNPIDKPREYECDHQIPTWNKRGFIRIRETYLAGENKGEKKPFEKLWANACFELHNIANAEAFMDLYNKACSGMVSRNLWIVENTKLEYRALKRTVDFYEEVWKPWAEEKGFKTNPAFWRVNLPKSYDEWIGQYKDKSGYPWNYWGRYYDESIIPYLKAAGILK